MIAGVAVLTMGSRKLSDRTGFPFAGTLLIIGFLGSELATFAGADIGLRWYHFRDIVFYGIVPLLVLNTALQLDIQIFKSVMGSILLLTIPIGVLTGCVVAMFVYSGINHPVGFPILVALLLGGILTANEPEHLLERIPLSSVSDRFSTLLKGESMFNDIIAVMLFSLLIELILMHDSLPNVGLLVWQPIWLLGGGIGVGVLGANLIKRAFLVVKGGAIGALFIIIAAYGLYFLSDKYLAVSGVASLVAFGLTLKSLLDIDGNKLISGLADFVHASLYLLVGVSFTLGQFTDRWIAILLGTVGLVFGRILGSYFFLVINKLCRPNSLQLTKYEKIGIALSGTPGAIALALALSLPLEVPAWYTVQSAVYGVVAIGIFIHAPLAALILSKVR